MTSKELGVFIYRRRKMKRISQKVLADKVNTTREQISRIENAAIDTSFSTVVSIMDALGVKMDLVAE